MSYEICGCGGVLHQLLTAFKKAYNSAGKVVLYNILVEFGICIKLLRLIEMYLNETAVRVRTGKHLFETFSIYRCFIVVNFNFAL